MQTREQQIAERAADILDEWRAGQALDEPVPLETLRAERIAGSLCGYFASVEMESEPERGVCYHAMEREIADAGGMVYVPLLDGSPCVTTAEHLRTLAGVDSWADALHAFDATAI